MKNLNKKQLAKFNALTINKSRTEYKQVKSALESGSGEIRTGKSGSGFKNIWTASVINLFGKLGIECESGNDAPRGGANGEFVKITDKVILSKLKKTNKEIAALKQAENDRVKEVTEKIKSAKKAEIEMMRSKIDEQWFADKAQAMTLVSNAKSDAFFNAMRGLLKRSGVDNLNFFYDTMRAL